MLRRPHATPLANFDHLRTIVCYHGWITIEEWLKVPDCRYEKHLFFPTLSVWDIKITMQSQRGYLPHKYITTRETTSSHGAINKSARKEQTRKRKNELSIYRFITQYIPQFAEVKACSSP